LRKLCQIAILVVTLSAAFFIPHFPLRLAGAILPSTTGAVGTSPSAYGQLIAFSTPEVAVQIDLNGDGDFGDRVIRYYNVESGALTNTGVVGDFPSLFDELIVFTGPGNAVSYYNITSSTLTSAGLVGERARLHDDLIVFAGNDQKIRVYNVSTGVVENTGALGASPAAFGTTVAFSTLESLVGADLNGDGVTDPFTSVARYYDTRTHAVVNTRALADHVSVYGSIIAFDYALNAPVRFYNTTSGSTVNTGTIGLSPAVYGSMVFVENGTIRHYDMSTSASDDTRVDGNALSVHRNLVAFETDENIVNKDLNGDHQVKDVVVRYFHLPLHDIGVTSLTASATDLNQPAITLTAAVANLGGSTETFSLSFLWNSTLISLVPGMTLGSGGLAMVSVQWTTGSLSPGTYTISARASVVPDENETVNNVYAGGTLTKPAPPIGGAYGGGIARQR
jgi:hypothetical protein